MSKILIAICTVIAVVLALPWLTAGLLYYTWFVCSIIFGV